MKLRTFIVLGCLTVACSVMSGCLLAAAGVAAGAYTSSVADDDRKAFHANNIEREKAGLKPLTRDEWLERQTAVDTNKVGGGS